MNLLTLEILTNDLAATERFYRDALGLPVIQKTEDSTSFAAGHSTLIFTQANPSAPRYHFAFNIPCNKLEEAATWASKRFELLTNAEGKVVNQFVSWNAEAIYFYDNNYNILEFIARFDLVNSTEESFESNAILSISEIGIATDNPSLLASQLTEENGLHYFQKSIPANNFIPLGDDDGLLILVATGRNWFPTTQPAQKEYVKVQIATNNGSVSELIFNEALL